MKVRYNSNFEKRVHQNLLPKITPNVYAQQITYTYTAEKTYLPDFVIDDLYIECKGRFRTHDEARKYLFIRDEIEKNGGTFVFLFMDGATPMPRARRRKDGTKYTVSEWADTNSLNWTTEENFYEWASSNYPALSEEQTGKAFKRNKEPGLSSKRKRS